MGQSDYSPNRREFIKTSAAGTTGLMIGAAGIRKVFAAGQAVMAEWSTGMQVHPNISNTRAVFIHDDEMVIKDPVRWTVKDQNENVNQDKVYEAMDKMAVALAGLPAKDPGDLVANAKAAWATIFKTPAQKAWKDVVVGIRPNCLVLECAPRWAVVKKLCLELNRVGVQYGNIIVFDAGVPSVRNKRCTEYYADAELPSGVQLLDKPEEDATTILPGGQEVYCPKILKDGVMDLLINVPVNKGHDLPEGGGFTLAMKNHLGVLKGKHDRKTSKTSLAPDIIAINKAGELISACQLHVLDGIWGTKRVNYGIPDDNAHILAMGTFAPILDYLVVNKIRIPEKSDQVPWGMGVINTQIPVLERYVSAFGYDPQSEAVKGLDLINAMAYKPAATFIAQPGSGGIGASNLTVTVSVSHQMYQATFTLPRSAGKMGITIFAMDGSLLRSLNFSAIGKQIIPIIWDGRSSQGRRVPPGIYNVVLTAGRKRLSRQLVLT